MAKGMYLGVGTLSKKIKKLYVGVGGVSKKAKKVYIGVNGVAKLCWSGAELPTFTGSHAIFGSAEKGYMECYGSGTFNPLSDMVVEAFLVGAGSGGSFSSDSNSGAGGGAGGFVKLITSIPVLSNTSYTITIGAGGLPGTSSSKPGKSGGTTTAFSQSALGAYEQTGAMISGSNGGTGGGSGANTYYAVNAGDGGTNGSNGTGYAPGTGDSLPKEFNGKRYAGGAGGGARASFLAGKGKDGAGDGGTNSQPQGFNATPNTGSGGGGGASGSDGGVGASGIVIIRWGY